MAEKFDKKAKSKAPALLAYLEPVLKFVPEIQSPAVKPQFQYRLFWTIVPLLIFLVACQIPVYGIRPNKNADPFYWLRVIIASNKGTIMELGISPMVTASMVMEVFKGARLISINNANARDKALYNGTQKLLGLAITVIEAVAYVFSGMYGNPQEIGAFVCLLIVAQLVAAGVLCLLLDEVLQEYGMGSGTSLFIAVNIAETIVWKAFSPQTLNTGRGSEFEGAILALFHLLITRDSKSRALKEAFYRPQLPNIMNLLATAVVFGVVLFTQGFKVNIGIQHLKSKMITQHPIKLFYTSNMPIILQSALTSNLFFFSQILYRRFPNNIVIGLLGKWEETEYAQGGQPTCIGGLSYYLAPPQGFSDMLADPFRTVFYVVFVCATCAVFSRAWIDISNQSATDVAGELKKNDYRIIGVPENQEAMERHLNRYIPTAAAFGGLCVGALTIMGDFLGAIGSGTGILLSVSIITGYLDTIKNEGHAADYLNFLRR